MAGESVVSQKETFGPTGMERSGFPVVPASVLASSDNVFFAERIVVT